MQGHPTDADVGAEMTKGGAMSAAFRYFGRGAARQIRITGSEADK
jgi:hypothetical protein